MAFKGTSLPLLLLDKNSLAVKSLCADLPKCAQIAVLNSTCYLFSACRSYGTSAVSTLQTVERKFGLLRCHVSQLSRVCQRSCNRAVTGSLCVSASHCNRTGLGTQLELS
jgi:hypothetical protein